MQVSMALLGQLAATTELPGCCGSRHRGKELSRTSRASVSQLRFGFLSSLALLFSQPHLPLQPLTWARIVTLTKILDGVDISGHGRSSAVALLDFLSRSLDKAVIGRVDLGECVCHGCGCGRVGAMEELREAESLVVEYEAKVREIAGHS